MRPSRLADASPLHPASPGDGPASEMTGLCRTCPASPHLPAGTVSSPMPASAPLCDWIDSQANVLGLWLDRLIEQGDPEDLISMVHRQQAWLEMLRTRMVRG